VPIGDADEFSNRKDKFELISFQYDIAMGVRVRRRRLGPHAVSGSAARRHSHVDSGWDRLSRCRLGHLHEMAAIGRRAGAAATRAALGRDGPRATPRDRAYRLRGRGKRLDDERRRRQARRALIRSYGCGTCHLIPGIRDADGLVGPPLTKFADRVYVAGMLRNTPDNLERWLEHPQAIVPGNAMPDQDIDEAKARDIAAYLYRLH
jgi:hypothetical protein